MKKNLPPRPNLDHLRRQAKSLLAALEAGNKDAAVTMQNHLPAAKDLTLPQVLASRYRLADAQSAIARKTGFAGWPHLARHVEQLRALEGTWSFARLEIDGNIMPAGALKASRLLIDGDRFRTESPEANYEGVFNINVESDPHEIDIEFIEGPEAGNWNFGIFCVEGDELEICLDLNGKPRPDTFATSQGSGRALEKLKRTSPARPEGVTGGNASPLRESAPTLDPSGFEYVESPVLSRLQGQWSVVRIVLDGQELPSMMLATGLRVTKRNEVRVSMGGQTMVHALMRLCEGADAIHVDYYNLAGGSKGRIQHGLLKWIDEDACFCMAGPDQPRPDGFDCPRGSGRTLSQWRVKA